MILRCLVVRIVRIVQCDPRKVLTSVKFLGGKCEVEHGFSVEWISGMDQWDVSPIPVIPLLLLLLLLE